MRVRRMAAITLAAAAATTAMAVPAAGAEDVLLPHPGPEGLVWVPERTGDGGVASGGAWDRLPTVLTVACEGGGSVAVSMDSQQERVADFSVDCPADGVGVGAVTMDPGVVKQGSFTIGVDASNDSIRWSLTVTQPE
ncbi:hypothetical protein ACIRPP_31485 [Streptomyces sp. NPDC101219]|uniref:hypothetical protein n=1 Tax=Streptomyces sp. NPDC101219 TaxID=3366131 RepID=UPI00381C8566